MPWKWCMGGGVSVNQWFGLLNAVGAKVGSQNILSMNHIPPTAQTVVQRWMVINMNKSIYWSVAIKNSICVICWTALAIIFHKWWIALFGALFLTSVTSHRYYRVCDKCGKHSPDADSYNAALDSAKAAGWTHIVDGNKDYCPDCMR